MDPVIRSNLHYQDHTGVLTHETTQPTEDLILQRNAELRKNPGVIQDLGAQSDGGSFGRQVASIPIITYDKALRNGFEFNKGDAQHRRNEIFRFLQTEDGKKCIVQG